MTFYVYDGSELGEVYLTSEDYEHDFVADVRECYNPETEQYDMDGVRRVTEAQIKAEYGSDTEVVWGEF